ncbi:hypothetical protein PCC79_03535 [Propioniciclava soli]|uniref:Uncharacterized protein n=1 Tax=Propioniciclava soli TaxID=2775081 RepID=A0ABZ3C9U2_9ACTN
MIPPWWGIPVILVVGIAVVWFGWWHDRRRARHAATALREPPPRPTPRLDDSPQPTYTTEDDLRAGAVHPKADPALIARRPGSPTLPAGTHGAFLDASGLATRRDPVVLVTDAPITEDHQLLSLLQRARRGARPLVVVAPAFSPDALGTLLANALSGRIASLPVTLTDADERLRAATLTGGHVVDADDLASGFLPPHVWGTCHGWVSDATTSWVVRAA